MPPDPTIPSRSRPGDPGWAPRRRWGTVLVEGRSMLPTLRPGDQLLVWWGRRPATGKLVVIRLSGGRLAVKRALRHDGSGWWVERDNPREGADSWLLGAVPDSDVLGTVVLRYWAPRLPRGRDS